MTASLEDRGAGGAIKKESGEPLLSVIVPVYNVLPYLDGCIESLLAQRYERLEILLIDDGSTDGSGELCDTYAKKDSRIRVIHKENGGQASAKNVGIDQAEGHMIAFMDGDDWLDPDMYAVLLERMAQNGATVGACGFAYEFDDRVVPTGGDTGLVYVYPPGEALLQMALQQNLMFESTLKVYARHVVGEARFPEGKLYEEVAFARLLIPRLGNVVYVDRPYYHYRQNRPGNTNSSFPESKLAVVDECDAFVQDLEEADFLEAAKGMEAFTLEHLMRMSANARACRAQRWIHARIRRDYRKRFFRSLFNPYVRKARGALFAVSPRLYGVVSQRLHAGNGARKSERSEES